jgi:hypothetical protein
MVDTFPALYKASGSLGFFNLQHEGISFFLERGKFLFNEFTFFLEFFHSIPFT